MYTDNNLVQSLRIRDIDAVKFTYQKYGSLLYAMVLKHHDTSTSDLIFASCFKHIVINIDKYDPDKTRLFTWMYRITVDQLTKELPLVYYEA